MIQRNHFYYPSKHNFRSSQHIFGNICKILKIGREGFFKTDFKIKLATF